MILFWFRRDLRLDDNAALFQALSKNENVLPIFIFDDTILMQLDKNDARISFIHQNLKKIQEDLQKKGKSIAVFKGNPLHIIEKLVAEHQITAVYTNRDYEPYARKRDYEIYEHLKSKSIAFVTCKDQVIFEKSEIVKDDGTPYVVYTPFSKKWKANVIKTALINYNSEDLLNTICKHDYPFLTLEQIGFEQSQIAIASYDISSSLIQNYEETRNYPALNKTSFLGIYLRFGVVSIRKIVKKALEETNETFLNELIWREFFMQILWHFPNSSTNCFRPKYENIQWENNEILFKKWCEGKTGFPLVDAGMRELNATGTMHNRVRMLVASFLCKHLLIDWRWGETYFAQKLLDYEQASNVGNWQWASGSGVDAAPYFRIFNPTEQQKKFDKNGEYIKKWIPELETFAYPKPIVDHKIAREKCLKIYKDAVG